MADVLPRTIFDNDGGIMKRIICIIVLFLTVLYCSNCKVNAASISQGIWMEDTNGWWFSYNDGTYAINEFIDGCWIGEDGYYDSDWIGEWEKNSNGWWFQSGCWYPSKEWVKINSEWYHFDSKGYMETNKWIGDYYVGSDGKMLKDQWIGLYYVDENGKWADTNTIQEKKEEPKKEESKKEESKKEESKKEELKKKEPKKEEPKKEEPQKEEPKKEEPKKEEPKKEDTDYNNYSEENGVRRQLDVRWLGTIEGIQSFCRYGDYYYSTDGSHIYVQDLNFNLLETVDVDLGHGNSFQRGNNQYVYVSGWDDNAVYVVNLDTLEVVEKMDLPTTGYTTCAVDEEDGIIYIFQRDVFPNSDEYYNFIIYDYINKEILSKDIIDNPFGAMQSTDYDNGKIYVLNGLGKAMVKNGFCVYDKNGKMEKKYNLGQFENSEPEGVYVDKLTNSLFISFSDRNIYLIKEVPKTE